MIKFSINDLHETSIADLKCIQYTIKEELARREMERVSNFIDFLENINDDDWDAIANVFGKDACERMKNFCHLMKS